MGRAELVRRAEEYANRRGSVLDQPLGFGVHGSVFSAEDQSENGKTAIKVHQQSTDYIRERDAYLRLRDHGITAIRDCAIPQLIRYDDELLIIEMTVVTRPYVLDFGGAFLDQPPGFSEEILAEWRAEKQEQFGKRWPEVQAILGILEGYGIFVVDVNANNISWPD
jgi:hypothetical protein